MKEYMVYMDDGEDCFKVAVPANDEKAERKYAKGRYSRGSPRIRKEYNFAENGALKK